jgi:antitoxin ParD1/3/4
MNVSLTPELEKFVDDKVDSGLYNNASEVIRESLRLLKEHDEIRVKWREQIERGWLQAQRGELVDGDEAFPKRPRRRKRSPRRSTVHWREP